MSKQVLIIKRGLAKNVQKSVRKPEQQKDDHANRHTSKTGVQSWILCARGTVTTQRSLEIETDHTSFPRKLFKWSANSARGSTRLWMNSDWGFINFVIT
jgi:hypothetical protein